MPTYIFIALLTPFIIILMALISMGIGLILSSMTTKYKDLNQLIGFGVQLFMYATPVIYPSSSVPQDYQWVVELNPLVGLFDYMRYAYLGVGEFAISDLVYPSIFSIASKCSSKSFSFLIIVP